MLKRLGKYREYLGVNRKISIFLLIGWFVLWAVIVIVRPSILGDSNRFLLGFVNENFLSFMGVVVTITIGSASNIYLELNKIEEKIQSSAFPRTKADIKHSVYALIASLSASVVLVVVKPLFPTADTSTSILNGCAITIIIVAVTILIDLTKAAFSLDIHGQS